MHNAQNSETQTIDAACDHQYGVRVAVSSVSMLCVIINMASTVRVAVSSASMLRVL